MEKKKCELCGGVARMFCESDQASLCWDCDGKVHGANFLVAKHTRCLLCSACQSPTPWKASGLRLCPTVSICESCLARKNRNNLSQEINSRDCDGDRLGREDDGAESYDEEEDEEEEEAENQVVPAQLPPVVSSSSSVCSGEEAFSGDGGLIVKRTRMDLDLNLSVEEESIESRPLKRLSKSRDEASSRSTAKMLRLNGCDTSSSSSTLVSKNANKITDLSA
ncbi:hypothetical protein AALP_AA8G328800 [Arabis alpina]|uniref:B box-type domain-containing protein n=1 Tax=Arabis alpina TaxID=50452 RepID=A0A087GB05_ARAAL|nr:hypothetical protein AALP_AA8G328800 [Arabis alpina]